MSAKEKETKTKRDNSALEDPFDAFKQFIMLLW